MKKLIAAILALSFLWAQHAISGPESLFVKLEQLKQARANYIAELEKVELGTWLFPRAYPGTYALQYSGILYDIVSSIPTVRHYMYGNNLGILHRFYDELKAELRTALQATPAKLSQHTLLSLDDAYMIEIYDFMGATELSELFGTAYDPDFVPGENLNSNVKSIVISRMQASKNLRSGPGIKNNQYFFNQRSVNRNEYVRNFLDSVSRLSAERTLNQYRSILIRELKQAYKLNLITASDRAALISYGYFLPEDIDQIFNSDQATRADARMNSSTAQSCRQLTTQ